ncbi:MAG: DASS family sodium-coupled anion symporter [Saprospiraceae bacterium]
MPTQRIGLWLGLGTLLLFTLLPAPAGMPPLAMRAAGVTLLMTIWWVTEAIPIYATAFVPLVAFPLLGIVDAKHTSENYGHPYVLMLLGGFFIAKAIEVHHLHKRIALLTIRLLGNDRRRLILSFMIATAFLSMWIANVAVALLMLPIAIAIIDKEEVTDPNGKFGLALMLAIAYAASVGGTATLIGTPPNMAFVGILETLFPEAPSLSFFDWFKVGFPLVVVFIPVVWFYIVRYFSVKGALSGSRAVIHQEYEALGKLTSAEKRVLIIFALTAFGWIFRRDFDIGSLHVPGWESILGLAGKTHDAVVAILGALFLFILPAEGRRGERLLNWHQAQTVPWGVVMIVGGGYAIAQGFATTGLAEWIGGELAFISRFPTFLVVLLVVGLMIFLTEVNSNTATANIFLPVLATMAVAGNANPLLLMIPATFACSFAFMMPSGTGTNTVIFASGRVSIPEMARCGLWLNIIFIILLTLMLYLLVIPALGIEARLPGWAG